MNLQTLRQACWFTEGDVSLCFYLFKEAGNSFPHFSNSHILKDEYYHFVTSNAATKVSTTQSLVNKLRSCFLYDRLPLQQYNLLKTPLILAYNSKSSYI